jgi:DNA-binding CsgD family transcriptional regulator
VTAVTLTLGRAEEIRAVTDAVTRGRAVVISGALGVGKSHVLRQVVDSLATSWWIAPIVANQAAATIPFGAVATMLPPADVVDQHALLRAAVDRFLRQTQGKRSLLAVDDAHHLDAASTALLHELCVARRVPLVATVRAGESLPLAVAELFKDAGADRIELDVLPVPIARQLVAATLQVSPTDPVVEAMSTRSGGNPLFLGELVRAHQAGTPGGLTGQLRDLVQARLDTLSGDARRVMEYVAIGEPVLLAIGLFDDPALAELERAGLVTTDVDGDGALVARTAHPLFGEVVRAGLRPASFRLAAKRLSEAMLTVERRRGDALRLAGWLLDVGAEIDRRLAVEAAREALAWLDIGLAERLLAVALAGERDYDALFVAGELRRVAGDTAGAEEWFVEASAAAGSDGEIVEVAVARSQVHGHYRADPVAAIGVLDEAAARVTDPAKKLELGIERTVFTAALGRFDDVLDAAAELLRNPERDDRAEWGALSSAMWAEVQLMRLDQVDAHTARLDELYPEVIRSRPGSVDMMWSLEVTVALERGDVAGAIEHGVRRLRDAPRLGVPGGLTEFAIGHVRWLRGDLAGAQRALDRAIAKVALSDTFNTLPLVTAGAAQVAAAVGDMAGARDLLDGADRHEARRNPIARLWLERAAGWLAVGDDPDGAVATWVRASGPATDFGLAAWSLMMVHDAVMWEGAVAATAALDRLAALPVDAPFMQLLVDHGRARAAGDADWIARCAAALEATGAIWYAANAWAAVAAGSSDEAEQARAATRAVVLAPAGAFGRHGDVVTAVALSPRQVEVARLAAAGATSKAIAEQTFLSTRTVENHLARIYRRLDIDGRSALAAVVASPDGEYRPR